MLLARNFTKINSLRRIAVRTRLCYYLARRKLKTLQETSDSYSVTVKHNLKGLSSCNNRMLDILMPLFACECHNPLGDTLIVGPRNEHDLFLYLSLGGSWSNLRGVDLISYSPKIDLGDMHNLPYASASFDSVICGWTLSYSKYPSKAVDEFLRVLRPGGMVSIGVEYSIMNPDDSISLQSTLDGDSYDLGFDDKGRRILNSTADIKSLLPQNCLIFFEHDAPLKRSHNRHGLVPEPSRVIIVAQVF
jgi:hypothetical protein